MHHREGHDFRRNPRSRLGLRCESRGFAAVLLSAALLFLVGASCAAFAQCSPEQPPLQNYTGGGQVVCPCFIAGEEAAVILDAPTYPIEILRVGIGWGSQFGGQPQTIENSINIYPAGLPNPGTAIYTLLGPVMTDGVINEFDLEPEPGQIVLDSGPFTVSLRFQNDNSGNIFSPSVVHDGNGCQAGKNAVKAIPGGWMDACPLGVTGDWVMYVIYRDCSVTGVGDEHIATNAPVALFGPRPNPFVGSTEIEFLLAQEERVELSVYDVRGRRVAVLEDGRVPAGRYQRAWNGKSDLGVTLPAGIYFLSLRAGDVRETRKISYIR
jgi:hypothetical protein